MKKTLIITGIVVVAAFILLYVFNKLTSKSDIADFYTEAKTGEFEIAVTATGELMAENSLDIKGPEFATRRDIRSTNIRIQDLVAEGTMVKKGDYIASLDKTELDNDLKNQRERLTTLQANLEMKLLDTAVN